jgi:hypothetical protein
MNGLRERYADALITLHTFSEAQTLASYVATELSTAYGPLYLWCYLREDSSGQCRLVGVGGPSATGEQQNDSLPFRGPETLPPVTMHRAGHGLSSAVRQTMLGEQAVAMLRDTWGESTRAAIQAATACQYAAVRAVLTKHGTVGLVTLASVTPLSDDVALEVTGHVAVALTTIYERSISATSPRDPFMRSMVAHVAQREVDRANRYQRPLSLAVLEFGGADPHPRALMTATSLITRVMRLPDTVGRLDDGHLAVLLPETAAAGAQSFLRRLNQAASRATVSFHGALATCPDDGRSWDELRAIALARLSGTQAEACESGPLAEAFHPPAAIEDEEPQGEDDLQNSVEAVLHRVRVAPLEQREVGPWQLLLQRLPPVLEVDLDGFHVDTALFRVKATSIRRLLRELRRAARTMQADFSVGLDESSIRLWSEL